jgi:hypothetical protein
MLVTFIMRCPFTGRYKWILAGLPTNLSPASSNLAGIIYKHRLLAKRRGTTDSKQREQKKKRKKTHSSFIIAL